jgi:uncharacterized protein (TIGR03083 family)
MADLDIRRRGALDDLDALIDTLEKMPADAWEAKVPCEGWTVRDLATHLTGTIPLLEGRLAGFIEKRTGETGTASGLEEVPPSTSPREIVTALRVRRQAIARQLERLTDADLADAASEGQGFLAQTPELYLDLATFEAAIHRNDLDAALGDVDAPISDHGLAAIDAILASNMVNFARMMGVPPTSPLSISFTSPSINHTLSWTGSGWSDGPPEGVPSARIAGTDSAVARFICGRIPVDDPLLIVDGDIEIARQFKTFVPGP